MVKVFNYKGKSTQELEKISNDEYYLSIGATGEDRRPIALNMIGDQVSRIINANPTIQVLIEGDSEADWGAMITLITTLQQAGVTNPNFITQPLNICLLYTSDAADE